MINDRSFLSRFGGAVNQGMENYNNGQLAADDEMSMKLLQVNPAFAMQYSGLANIKRQNMEDQRKKSALSRIAKDIQLGLSPSDALLRLGEETGDTSMFSKALSPEDVGATGNLVKKVMADNPGMTFTQALQLVQTGFRQNTYIDPNTGRVVAAEGAADALGELGMGEEYGKKTGELTARGKLEPDVEADIVTAKSEAAYTAEGKQALPKQQRALVSKELREDFLNDKMDSISSRANEFTTGFGGSLISAVKGTPAYDLKVDVDTLLANAGFDRLQEMRDNSPAGGALGNVTEVELQLLQSSAQALYQSQSKEQFLANLAAFKEQRRRSLLLIREAYKQDYQRFGGAMDKVLPSPKETINGNSTVKARKRYNPATGRLE